MVLLTVVLQDQFIVLISVVLIIDYNLQLIERVKGFDMDFKYIDFTVALCAEYNEYMKMIYMGSTDVFSCYKRTI